jgi:ATP-binding cassette subfamily B (MDR/TAP) protein 1
MNENTAEYSISNCLLESECSVSADETNTSTGSDKGVNEVKQSADKKKKTNNQNIRFVDLFTFTEGSDKIVLGLAILFSCLQGFIFPIFSLVFGSMGTTFVTTPDLDKIKNSVEGHFIQMMFLALIILISSFISSALWNYTATKQSKKLKMLYFKSLLYQKSEWFDSKRIDIMAGEFVEHVNNFSLIFSYTMNFYFLYYSQAIGGIFMGFYSSWLFTGFILILILFMRFSLNLSTRQIASLESSQNRSISRTGALIEQAVRLIKTIKSLNGEQHEIRRLADISAKDESVSVPSGYKKGWYWALYLFVNISIFGVVFYVGLFLVSHEVFNINTQKKYTINDIISVIFTILPGILSFTHISQLEIPLEKGKSAIGKILEITKNLNMEVGGSLKPDNIKGDIEFQNVSFSYPSNPQQSVIKNLNLKINAGQKVGIVGSSGSGKTTIVQLLERFYDVSEGAILIDGIDIKEYDIESLRSFIGIVSQQPILLSDSIYNNITLGFDIHNPVVEEEVWRILEKVNAKRFVQSIPDGLHTQVSNGGNNLSYGQKQKIAVARMLFKKPSFFLFDESTSALDKEDEKKIQKNLDEIISGSTNVHIAHKISSVVNSDIIYVMHEGLVVEQGTHTELLKSESMYYSNLIKHQKDDLDEETNENKNIAKFASSKSIYKAEDDNELRINMSIRNELSGIKTKNPSSNESLYDAIYRYLAGSRILIFYSLFCSIGVGLMNPIVGYISSKVLFNFGKLENLINEKGELSLDENPMYLSVQGSIYNLIVLQFITALATGILALIQIGAFNHISSIFLQKIKERYINKLMYTDLEYFDRPENQPGHLALLLTKECRTINLAVNQSLPIIIQSVFTFIFCSFISSYFCWRITLFSLLLIPLLVMFKIVESKFTVSYNKQSVDINNTVLTETLNNMKLIRSINAQSSIIAKFENNSSDFLVHFVYSLLAGIIFGFSQLFNYIVYAFIFIFGTKFTVDYGLDIKDTICAMLILIFGLNTLLSISEAISTISAAKTGFNEISNKTSQNSNIELDPNNPRNKQILLRKKKVPINGKIEFRNVSFRYNNSQSNVLDNLSFTLEARKSVGIFGKSSSGKSTILELLMRFYEPQSGQIFLDGISIKEFDIVYLRSLFGVTRQETELFNGTITYNICYNVPLSEQELLSCASEANILEFTSRDSKGFMKNVGNKGEKMSGGQKQRIFLARIFARSHKICLFDEPTSALDSTGEALVLESLEKLRSVKTSLTFSNRLRAVQNCELIYVLENGKITEQGSFEKLMSMNDKFARFTKE